MKIKLYIFTLILLFNSSFSFAVDNNMTNDNNLRNMLKNSESVIYGINIRTFNANDINNNDMVDFQWGETSGNFINAVDRLNEIKNYGINTIHVLPFTPVGKIKAMGTAGSLYALSDFSSINPQLIDKNSNLSPEEQLKFFIDAAHNMGFKVIADIPPCGSYDLYLKKPDIFILKNDNPISFSDWDDVLQYKISENPDRLKNSEIFALHKKYIDMLIDFGFDGLWAGSANIKPQIFWQELITYTREKNKNFAFIADPNVLPEVKNSKYSYSTDSKKLLYAGFDSLVGNFYNLKNCKSPKDLKTSYKDIQKLLKQFHFDKSIISAFSTHDSQTPFLYGQELYSKIIFWLNATLPLNPYYLDGFIQGDDYLYSYANKRADNSFTDDDTYFVHRGQFDIFNFSRKPGLDNQELISEYNLSAKFRKMNLAQITKGKFIVLKTSTPEIIAYARCYDNKTIIIAINNDLKNMISSSIRIKSIPSTSKIHMVKTPDKFVMKKGCILSDFAPGDILVLSIDNFKI